MTRYSHLLAQFRDERIPYPKLLEPAEWNEKRACILARDEFKRRKCGRPDTSHGLQVHHEHYIVGRLPWEYPEVLLVTICDSCHDKLHDQHKVFFYQDVGGKFVRLNLVPCVKCSGSGWFPQWEHIEGGICFRCREREVESRGGAVG
jgi:hypothetical protein